MGGFEVLKSMESTIHTAIHWAFIEIHNEYH